MARFDDYRTDWHARGASGKVYTTPVTRRSGFAVHYNGGTPMGLADQPHSACLEAVRKDQDFHMDGRGWFDIGYNALVCQHGRKIEGRGVYAIAAHCEGHNTAWIGAQFMVGGDEAPTPEAFAAMRELYDDCCAEAGHALGKYGHRDGYNTLCPGDGIEAWVKAGMLVRGGDGGGSRDKHRDPVDKGLVAPPYPLPAGWYFGPKSGPAESVSGYYGHRLGLRRWQKRMSARGWALDADGLYGPQTKKVCKQFQKQKGLTVDGLIGPATWDAAWTEPVT